MTSLSLLRRSSALLTCLALSGPAFALEPADVWGSWQGKVEAAGQSLSYSSVDTADGMTIWRDVELRAGNDEAEVVLSVPAVAMRQAVDSADAVQIQVSPRSDLDIYDRQDVVDGEVAEAGGPPVIDAVLTHEALTLTAQDVGGDIAYSLSARELLLTADVEEIETITRAHLVLGARGLSLSSLTEAGEETTTLASLFKAGDISVYLDLEGEDPSGVYEADLAFGLRDIAFNYVAALPSLMLSAGADPDALPTLLALVGSPMHVEQDWSFGPMTLNAHADMPEGGATLRLEGDGGTGRFLISNEELTFETTRQALRGAFSFPPMGLVDVPLGMEKSTADMHLPFPVDETVASGEVQTARLGFTLEGVHVGEDIWSFFDPNGYLVHDPATLALGLEADVRWTQGPTQMMTAFDPRVSPVEISGLRTTDLRLSFGGASMEGSVNLTTTPMAPTPALLAMARGKISLSFDGVLELIDGLGEMGLMPLQHLAVARGLYETYTVPAGDGRSLDLETRGDDMLLNGTPMR